MRRKERPAALEAAWARHKKPILVALGLGLAFFSVQRLASGFRALVLDPAGAVDLGLRSIDVHTWFSGGSLAGFNEAVYPPASMAMLWPFVGWASLPLTRWLWALTSAAALCGLAWFAVKECGRRDPREKAVLALIIPATYTVRAVLVNGQLLLHLLPAILGGVILLERREPGWKRDLGAAALMILAVTKPTVGAPFLLFLLFARRPVRPMALAAIGYAALSAFGSVFQPGGLWTQLGEWYGRARAITGQLANQTHANIPSWLHRLGLDDLNLPLSLLALALLAGLLYAFRRSDIWLRLGMAAVVTRFWSFHHRYDDILLIIPLFALVRIGIGWRPGAKTEGTALSAALLLGLSLMVPARLLAPGGRWTGPVESFQTIIWLGALACLVFLAAKEARRAVLAPAPSIARNSARDADPASG